MFDKTLMRGSMLASLRMWGCSLVLLAMFATNAAAQTLTTLCSFNGSNGLFPYGGLVLNGSTLYGTTSQGGDGGGNIFSVPISGGNPTILASFNYNTGQVLYSGVTLNGSTLYGTTNQGGAGGIGTVFSVPVGGGTPTVLASFNGSNGDNPYAGLTLGGNTLYGTTEYGGANNDGVVFSVPVSGGSATVLTSFNGSNGQWPVSSLILSGTTLYGTTQDGGANNQGVVFSLPITGGSPTILASLSYGGYQTAGLMLSGGTLYGTTGSTVFCLPVGGGSPTVLASFNGSIAGPYGSITMNGEGPSGLTLMGSTLYGTTPGGGAYGYGSVFSVPVGGGSPTILASFNTGNGGMLPYGSLIISGNTLYGMTNEGGAYSDGTVFAVSLPTDCWQVSSGSWNRPGNWNSGTVPNGAGQAAMLGMTISTSATVVLNMPVTLGVLQLGNSTQAATLGYSIVGSGTNGLTMNNNGAASHICVTHGMHTIAAPVTLAGNLSVSATTASRLTISGNIGQSGGVRSLTLSGGGELVLSGTDSYTGGTLVEAGTLIVTKPAAMPFGTSLVIGAGGTFIFDPTIAETPLIASPNSAVTPLPEPNALVLLGVAAVGFVALRSVRRPRPGLLHP